MSNIKEIFQSITILEGGKSGQDEKILMGLATGERDFDVVLTIVYTDFENMPKYQNYILVFKYLRCHINTQIVLDIYRGHVD